MNQDTGWNIRVSSSGADHSISTALNAGESAHDHMEIVRSIPNLLREARLVETHPDLKAQQGVSQVHRFYAPARMGDSLYAVKLTVKEMDGKYQADIEGVHKLHDMKLEKKMPVGIRPAISAEEVSDSTTGLPSGKQVADDSSRSTPDEMTLRALLEGVKDHQGQRFAQENPGSHDVHERGGISFDVFPTPVGMNRA